jgi:hypothetical protein
MPTIHPDPELYPSRGIYPGMEWPTEEDTTYTRVFDVFITDLYGTVLTWTDDVGAVHNKIEQYTDLSVDREISDDRKAKLTVSIYDPSLRNLIFVGHDHKIAALGRMIRIKYRGHSIFWGIVTQPKINTQKAQVEINCQGPAFKLRHRELNYGDEIVTREGDNAVRNPSDHRTMKAIVYAPRDTPAQYDENIPDIGIVVHNVSGPNAPAAFWTQIERGSNAWERLIEVASSAYGGEFDIVPYNPHADEIPFDTTMRPIEDWP